MGENINLVTSIHVSTKREYLKRMLDDKVQCMDIARRFDGDFFDGERRVGYGGYRYDGRWEKVAISLIERYRLNKESRVLDIGCGKAHLLYEIKKIIPEIEIVGIDISEYAIKNAKEEVKPYLRVCDARKTLPFENQEFDLVISLATLHNFLIQELKIALQEIERISKKAYVMVEAYRNSQELFNLECWALTCESFFRPEEWIWLYQEFGYSGDYEFIYFT